MYDFSAVHKALSVEDAIHALVQNEKAVLISGGSDVLVQIREGRLAGVQLVSIHDLPQLKGIALDAAQNLVIGSACTFSEITNHPLIQAHVPVLGEAVDQAGGPQLRHIGTIGGNVCNGVTSADSASTLLTLNAVCRLQGKDGIQEVPLAEYYTGAGKTVRRHDQVLLALVIQKKDYDGYFGHYIKYAQRNAMDIATLGCAVSVKLEQDKASIADLRLAFGVAAPTPIRCTAAEAAALGSPLTTALLDTVAAEAVTAVNPRTSWRASRAFRLQLVQELSKRCLQTAIQRAGGVIHA